MPKKEPIELLLYKGKKHLSKKEIEERKASEVKAPKDKIKPPTYLNKDLKKEFTKIANELNRIDILTNLDIDALARFIMVQDQYLKVSIHLTEISPLKEVLVKKVDNLTGEITEEPAIITNDTYSELLTMQDKLFKQARAASSDLGLTITSRCKLVIPKKEEDAPKSKEEKRFGGKL